jgi:hypothetical protein
MKWINLIGLTLQFLAFWFAAPELLGEQAMRKFEAGLKRLISALPIIIIFLVIALYAIGTAGYGIYTGLKGAESGMDDSAFMSYMLTLGVVFAIYLPFVFLYKRIQDWLKKKIANRLIDGLIARSEVRKQALIIGALLFSLGFLMQFFVVLLS